MKRLSPPQSEIKLYQTGFNEIDLLDRSDMGRQLSCLVDYFEEPIVLALDGRWGDGKSFFLKCWTGSHEHENSGKALLVYFDAFEKDYLGEPLVALTEALSLRISAAEGKSGPLEKLKKAVEKLWRPVLRVGLAAGTRGASEVVGAVGDAVLAKTEREGEELINNLWKDSASREAAFDTFRSSLYELTQQDGNSRKIVFIVDELDRCRPDYAIDLLEVVKHFFSVPNVHFVLGANLSELENSVRMRYGFSTDAQRYLQKHISITMQLPEMVGERGDQMAFARYFEKQSGRMGLDEKFSEIVLKFLKLRTKVSSLTLRDTDRVLSTMSLVSFSDASFARYYFGYRVAIGATCIIKILDPELYSQMRNEREVFEKVMKFFHISEMPGQDSHDKMILWQSFAAFLDHSNVNEEVGLRPFFDFGDRPSKGEFRRLLSGMFENFTHFGEAEVS